MTARAPLGRPPKLTRSQIGRAVVEVGFERATFERVAAQLGVGRATLFRYAPTRDTLILWGLQSAFEAADWPSLDGPWDVVLERWARAVWTAWSTIPGAVDLYNEGLVPPSVMAIADELGAVLIRDGFSPDDAVVVLFVVFDYVADSRRGIDALRHGAPRDARHRLSHAWGQWDTPRQGISTEHERSQVQESFRLALATDEEEFFVRKLTIVLDGVRAMRRDPA